MRIASHEGRLVIVTGDPGHELAHDVEKNSSGRFGPEPRAIYEGWGAVTGWAAAARWKGVGRGRNPQRWLADGHVLTSHIEGTGEMRHRFVAAGPVRKEN